VKKRLEQSRTLKGTRNLIIKVIDFFYPPFARFIPLKTFRYIACGGGNALLNLVVFFIANNFILPEGPVNIAGLEMQQYTGAFVIALMVSFPVGFALNKYVVFQQSHLKGRIQLFRYAAMTFLNIFLNWALLHFFAGFCGFWHTPSQAITTVILAVFSYFMQTYFSFRTKKAPTAMELPVE